MENIKEINNKKDNRIYYIDLLRIVCCFAVIMLHSAAGIWYKGDIRSFEWTIATIYDGIFRFAVPVFFMITGALMLGNKEKISIKDMYFKNIKKMLMIFIVWVLFYAIYDWYYYGRSITSITNVIDIIRSIGDNQFQLWFLPPLITYYMLMPILKEITKNRKILKYFLLLFFIFGIGRSTLFLLLNSGSAKIKLINLFTPPMITSYQGFVMLGYYLFTENLNKKKQNISYALGIIFAIITCSLTIILSIKNNTHYDKMFGYLMMPTFFVSIAIFNLFKYKFSNYLFTEKAKKIIKRLSDCTLGVYIFHTLFIDLLKMINISAISFNPLFSIPIVSIIVFLLSVATTSIIKKIPIVGKYLV